MNKVLSLISILLLGSCARSPFELPAADSCLPSAAQSSVFDVRISPPESGVDYLQLALEVNGASSHLLALHPILGREFIARSSAQGVFFEAPPRILSNAIARELVFLSFLVQSQCLKKAPVSCSLRCADLSISAQQEVSTQGVRIHVVDERLLKDYLFEFPNKDIEEETRD